MNARNVVSIATVMVRITAKKPPRIVSTVAMRTTIRTGMSPAKGCTMAEAAPRPPRRCMDCPRDATHTLMWHATYQRWYAHATDNQAALHLYCHWHATCRVVTRNARGVLPPMAQLRKILGTPERTEEGEITPRRTRPPGSLGRDPTGLR